MLRNLGIHLLYVSPLEKLDIPVGDACLWILLFKLVL